jgi:hypothetical protein
MHSLNRGSKHRLKKQIKKKDIKPVSFILLTQIRSSPFSLIIRSDQHKPYQSHRSSSPKIMCLFLFHQIRIHDQMLSFFLCNFYTFFAIYLNFLDHSHLCSLACGFRFCIINLNSRLVYTDLYVFSDFSFS